MTALDDLLALNTQLAALVRAGVPLELGLRNISATVTGRMGRLAERLSDRLSQGRSLVDALRQEGPSVSPYYTAVVEAALAADRLPVALEALGAAGQQTQQLRVRVRTALWEPMLVAVIAYALFALFVVFVGPSMLETQAVFRFERGWALSALDALHRWAIWWIPLAPVALIVLGYFASLMIAWMQRQHADLDGYSLAQHAAVLWIPGAARMFADLERAHTASILGLLIEHGVPIPHALKLSAGACRIRGLREACTTLAAEAERGKSLSVALAESPRGWPLLLRDVLRLSGDSGLLAAGLSQTAGIYARRAARRAEWIRSIVPVTFLVVIGGGVTLLYAAAIVLPLRWLLLHLFEG